MTCVRPTSVMKAGKNYFHIFGDLKRDICFASDEDVREWLKNWFGR